MTAGDNSFKNATAHKVNSYYTLAISYCTFCVGKHYFRPCITTNRRLQLHQQLHSVQPSSSVGRWHLGTGRFDLRLSFSFSDLI